MEGALDAGGTAIGVLADGLLHASSSANYRKQLLADTLVLLSPFYPEAGFNVGNAMARNKYIYCLADAAVVVHSGTSGGTWSGALENLEKKWVPTWVKRTDDAAAGNVEIETRGASWLPEKAEEVDVAEILSVATGPTRPQPVKQGGNVAESAATYRPRSSTPEPKDLSFYEFFLSKVEQVCGHVPRTMADLQKELDVTKAQLAAWLKRAVAEKKLRKVTRPVRYEWVGEDRQRSIF
jgi:predicted Rossmann fold nucleotide-binding protein DprA/Smf involved in DNA uptake